jgi:hypothetical protein
MMALGPDHEAGGFAHRPAITAMTDDARHGLAVHHQFVDPEALA